MKYKEKEDVTKPYKEDYIRGLEYIIEKLQKNAEEVRENYVVNIFSDPDKYRNDFKQMLGWPLVNHFHDRIPEVHTTLLSDEDGYKIYRMQFEILDGLNMTGLFFRQDGEEEKPLVIVQHGNLGTPELISGVYGDTFNYNDMLQRVRKYDVHIFAPQLLLWSGDYDVEFDRQIIDGRLKRVGSSITAIEVYGLTRVLDYFEQEKYISSYGMVGLSYGGFYTLYTTAVDTRIKSAISCSYFNKRDNISRPDWTWHKSSEMFDDAEIACLIYPRKLHIEVGNIDELFDYRGAVESYDKLERLCAGVGTEWVEFKVFDGVHEFFGDDEPIQKLVNDIR